MHLTIALNLLWVGLAAAQGRDLGKVMDWLNEPAESDSESEDEESLDEVILSYAAFWGPAAAFLLAIACYYAVVRPWKRWRWEPSTTDPANWPFEILESNEGDVEEAQGTETITVCSKHKQGLCTMGCLADYTLLNEVYSTSRGKRLRKKEIHRIVTRWFQNLHGNEDPACTGSKLGTVPPERSAAWLLKSKDQANMVAGFAHICYHYRSHKPASPSGIPQIIVKLAHKASESFVKLKSMKQRVPTEEPTATVAESLGRQEIKQEHCNSIDRPQEEEYNSEGVPVDPQTTVELKQEELLPEDYA